ncbi:DUF4421 domain-containing protein [Shivajiella indica]|uniref:DUF4421 domain-containing protein n=1 Tax=Shivajiella indica TaxID=872115 RepID=A0ABW5B9Z6_9BACT
MKFKYAGIAIREVNEIAVSLTLIVLLTVFIPSKVFSQEDTTYFVSYEKMLTTRLYTSRKYTSFLVKDNLFDNKFRFEPNSNLNLGIGATYNNLTLNIGIGFDFMNPERGRGETKFLDLQSHIYGKKMVIDLFGQFYNGYFLQKINGAYLDRSEIVVYPDMRIRKFGGSAQYLFNGEKISLKAAFHQSAWQKKSAGSFFTGMEVYGGWVMNEGNFIPESFQGSNNRGFQRLGFFQIGPNAGYVHTFVFWKHFFITGMFSGNIGIGNTNMNLMEGESRKWGVNFNTFLRGFIGYNGPVWSINANYINNNVRLANNSDFATSVMTGNYRINFVYRFKVGPKLRPFMDFFDLKRLFPAKSRLTEVEE